MTAKEIAAIVRASAKATLDQVEIADGRPLDFETPFAPMAAGHREALYSAIANNAAQVLALQLEADS